MSAMQYLKHPLMGLSLLRSLNYFVEYQALNALNRMLPQTDMRAPKITAEGFKLLADEIRKLFANDIEPIVAGELPPQILFSETPWRHAQRVPKIMLDGFRLGVRRRQKKAKEFTGEALEHLKEVPDYYRRNFHFQTDGYLSEHSAELYDHQVELLFTGAADPMRRIVLPELIHIFGDGAGKQFLEIACGTGSMTRNMRLAMPKARIVATDLSAPYLKAARKRLADYDRIDFLQGDATHLPLQDHQYDLVYSSFLFHELPKDIRTLVVREAKRVLKPGGYFVFVDSLQTGDRPKFDEILRQFPRDFHEPFYTNYIDTPMKDLICDEGFELTAMKFGFLAKGGVFKLKSQIEIVDQTPTPN